MSVNTLCHSNVIAKEPRHRLTVGCLFSGMGGFASGLSQAGFDICWANDNDQFACATFGHRFPKVRFIEKDVRELTVHGDGLSQVDVLAGGFPCQSFSLAGRRKGFEDLRGELFFEIPRLLNEFAPDRRPQMVILENVPHLLHGARGDWFEEIRRALREAGYWFRHESCWRVNVKDATDLPQDRERLFMVAVSRRHFSYNPFIPPDSSNSGPETCHINEFVSRQQRSPDETYLSEENRYYKMVNRKIESGESPENIYQLRRSYVREKKHGLCPTLTANMGAGGHNVPFIKDAWGIRKLSVDEVARLQGFDTECPVFPSMPDAEKYRLLGNAVCVPLACLLGRQCAEILRGEQKE